MGSSWKQPKGNPHPEAWLTIQCSNCGKEVFRPRWYQNRLERDPRLKRGGQFCSHSCSRFGYKFSDESRARMSAAQKGVSVPTRGRRGKSLSAETRQKIRLAKLGKPCKKDHGIIHTEMALRGIQKYAMLSQGRVPDAIYIEDGKLVALELEKKRAEYAIREKMALYEHDRQYDKIVIVWYSMDGKRLKEWHRVGLGDWQVLPSSQFT